MLKRIGLTHNPKRQDISALADEIAAHLQGMGVEVQRCETADTPAIEQIAAQAQLIIVVGGDGSTLRAARAGAPHKVAVLTVNKGRVGFLSELQPDDWRDAIPDIINQKYWVEERLMVTAAAYRNGKLLGTREAINDIVISHGTLARVVRLETKVDGMLVTTYSCDGLIVSTPTGSTAYALAAGGPIMPPTLRTMSLVPIAPHLSLEKPLVLAGESQVEISVNTDHQAILTADGQDEVSLRDGDRVVVKASANVALFARLRPPSYFYASLIPRLGGC
jgi:NAD+ kinase